MNLEKLIRQIKRHPDYGQVGMILGHNGVVRQTSRDGRTVTGLRVKVDHALLQKILAEHKKQPGIIEILIEIAEDRDLKVGDDVMVLAVAGDIREHVIATLSSMLNTVKSTVTHKTEFYQ
jgi:molybdopterin synthase catalytic subunit